MNEKANLLRKFEENHKPGNKKSILWNYADEIKILLQKDYTYKQVYIYLRDYRQIKLKEKSVYMFIVRNKDKILNTSNSLSNTDTKQQTVQQNKNTTISQSTPEQKKSSRINMQKQEHIVDDKDYERFLKHWKNQKSDLLKPKNKLSKDEFLKVVNTLIEKNLIQDFYSVEKYFSNPYKPERICNYLRTCRDKINNNRTLDRFTPEMYRRMVEDDFFQRAQK